MKDFWKKIGHAAFGVAYTAKSQKSFRILIGYALAAIILGIVLPITAYDWVIITFAITIVFTAEMTNTVAEFLCELIHKKKNVYVKLIKDISAGIVLVSVIWAAFAGAFVFIPVIITLL